MNRVSEHQAISAERAQRAVLSGLLVNSVNAQRFGTAMWRANHTDNCKQHADSQASQQKNADNRPAAPATSQQTVTESTMQTLNRQAQQVADCLQALSAIHAHCGAAADTEPAQSEAALRSGRAQELRALVDRCVRFALRSEKGEANDSKIYIVLAPELFPDTEIMLQRSGEGWRLDAQSAGDKCRQLLANGVAMLQQKFEAKGLGRIEVNITRHNQYATVR